MKEIVNDSYIREKQFSILKIITRLCLNNDIPIYLAYGSLLGCIRHSGFIPWDDDIDLMIEREYVDKLFEIVKNSNLELEIINSESNKRYFSPLIKIYDTNTILIQDYGQVEGVNLGIYLDIFVLDNVPSDEIKRKKFYKKAERLRFFWSLSCRRFNKRSRNLLYKLAASLCSIPFKIIGYKYYAMKYLNFCRSIRESKNVGIVLYGEGYEKEYCYLKADLKNAIFKKFEGIDCLVPFDYDFVLTKCYGDYMTLPPKENRYSKHNYIVYKK